MQFAGHVNGAVHWNLDYVIFIIRIVYGSLINLLFSSSIILGFGLYLRDCQTGSS